MYNIIITHNLHIRNILQNGIKTHFALDPNSIKEHIMHMKTTWNKDVVLGFAEKFETPDEATRAIQKALGCSESKAEKIRLGTYPSLPVPAELRVLSELFGCPIEVMCQTERTAS